MTPSMTPLTKLSRPLIVQFNMFCEEHGLVGLVQADHISIKCSQASVYDDRRREFEDKSTFIYQSIIADRRMSLIGLKEIIPTIVGDVRYLELADQKPDNSQIDRIDHIEIVPVTISYEELIQKLKDNNLDVKEIVRPHHTTHDITLTSGFIIRLSKEFLLDTIKRDELN